MSIDLGDIVPLSVNIFDANGHLANATSVSLNIGLPDGTTNSVGVISPSSTGVYQYDYTTLQYGRHTVRWLATGANASAFNDTFYVEPADSVTFISLKQFKEHIKKVGTSDDELLRMFTAAACQMITDRTQQIVPAIFTQDSYPAKGRVHLDHYPVISVTSVVYKDTSLPVTGYELSRAESGILTVSTTFFNNLVRTVYRAGMLVIPPNYILAGLELARHLWMSSQQNTGAGRPSIGMDPTYLAGTTFALPYNVRQLLGLDKRPTLRVLIG
jgi:hypothetical protein